jgi:hypothetical protein
VRAYDTNERAFALTLRLNKSIEANLAWRHTQIDRAHFNCAARDEAIATEYLYEFRTTTDEVAASRGPSIDHDALSSVSGHALALTLGSVTTGLSRVTRAAIARGLACQAVRLPNAITGFAL